MGTIYIYKQITFVKIKKKFKKHETLIELKVQ